MNTAGDSLGVVVSQALGFGWPYNVNANMKPIQACVAAVISAFRDGDLTVQQLKAKRGASQLPLPPSSLEECISEAPREIERERKRGIERCGSAFESGDHIAVIAIQRVTIELRSTLLEQLRYAVSDDAVTDFTAMIDLADEAREDTIAAMVALRRRLMSTGAVSEISEGVASPRPYGDTTPASPPPAPPMSPTRHFSLPPVQSFQQFQMHNYQHQQSYQNYQPQPDYQQYYAQSLPMHPVQRFQTFPSQPFMSPDQYPSAEEISISENTPISGGEASQQGGQKRHGSLFSFLRRNTTHSTSSNDTVQPTGTINHSPLASPASYTSNRSGGRHPGSPPDSRNTLVEVEEDPFETMSQHSSVPDIARNDTRSSVATDQSLGGSIRSTPATTISNVSIGSKKKPSESRTVVAPSPDNNYLGFCKGAWKAQNGDPKAMIERMDFAVSAQSKATYPSCSKCDFKGHQFTRILKNKVWPDERRNIKYRWTFLAKSHVKQKSATDRNYNYQCLFCIFLGVKDRVIYNESSYLDHISQEHRLNGNELDDVVLHRTGCVAGRVCKDNEKFDINLLPLTVNEREYVRKKRALSEDFGIGMPTPELAA